MTIDIAELFARRARTPARALPGKSILGLSDAGIIVPRQWLYAGANSANPSILARRAHSATL
jgi:hypothetical protein